MKFFRITSQILKEAADGTYYWMRVNARFFVNLFEFLLPFAMYELGKLRGGEFWNVGGELFIPVIAFLIIQYAKKYTDKSGIGKSLPVPTKRFTHVSEDGEVYVLRAEQEQMILYLADLEDWMIRRGYMGSHSSERRTNSLKSNSKQLIPYNKDTRTTKDK